MPVGVASTDNRWRCRDYMGGCGDVTPYTTDTLAWSLDINIAVPFIYSYRDVAFFTFCTK